MMERRCAQIINLVASLENSRHFIRFSNAGGVGLTLISRGINGPSSPAVSAMLTWSDAGAGCWSDL